MGFRRTKNQGALRTSRGRGGDAAVERPDLSYSDAFATFLQCLPRDHATTADSHDEYLRHVCGVLMCALRVNGGAGASFSSGGESTGAVSHSDDEGRPSDGVWPPLVSDISCHESEGGGVAGAVDVADVAWTTDSEQGNPDPSASPPLVYRCLPCRC
jgi:hypothetical protein